MVFVGGNPVFSCANKVFVYIPTSTYGVKDFEHNTVLSYVFEKTDID